MSSTKSITPISNCWIDITVIFPECQAITGCLEGNYVFLTSHLNPIYYVFNLLFTEGQVKVMYLNDIVEQAYPRSRFNYK